MSSAFLVNPRLDARRVLSLLKAFRWYFQTGVFNKVAGVEIVIVNPNIHRRLLSESGHSVASA